ncbi:hypothetical protein ES703_26592 [subsurface metagenome]
MLHYPLVPLCGLDALAPFEDIVAARLLDVNVLLCLAGPNGNQRMPVIRRCDGYDIDALVFQQFANINVGIDLFIAVFEWLGAAFKDLSVHIAQRHHTDSGHFTEFANV